MDSQKMLFGIQEQHEADMQAKHLARSTDPETSHKVAADIAKDGSVGRLQQLVIDTLIAHGRSLTANEVSDKAGVPNLHKRMAELERRGLIRVTGVRRCEVSKREAQTYFIDRD